MKRTELQRRHDQVRSAVAPRDLQLQHDLASGVGLCALVGQRRAGDVAAQLLQRLAVIGRAAHSSVQAEAVAVGTPRMLEVHLRGQCTLHRQHLPASARGGRTLLFAPPHRAGDDLVQHRLQRCVDRRWYFDEFRRAVSAAPLATERDQLVVATVTAAQPQEAVRADAALQERIELVLDEMRQLGTGSHFGLRDEGPRVLPHETEGSGYRHWRTCAPSRPGSPDVLPGPSTPCPLLRYCGSDTVAAQERLRYRGCPVGSSNHARNASDKKSRRWAIDSQSVLVNWDWGLALPGSCWNASDKNSWRRRWDSNPRCRF